MSRRRLLIAGGTGAMSFLFAPAAFGSDDNDKNDDNGQDDYGDDNSDDSNHHSGDDSSHDSSHDSSDDDGKVAPSGDVPAGSAEVRIVDDDENAFQPGTITVDLGQSVTWVNLDDDSHTASGAAFDTGNIDPGDLVTLTFDEPGTFPYSCQYHPGMVGTVEVRDATGTVPARQTASPEASPKASPQASPQAGALTEIAIQDFAFDPPEVEIHVGATVRWTNRDASPHTATSSSDEFDSGTLDEGDTFEFSFDNAGTIDYVCAFHPTMQGRIVVTN
jgi:plastocyanin